MFDYTRPNINRSALLTIDMQQDFTLAGAPAEVPGTIDIAPAVRRMIKLYRRRQLPIIHVVRLYLPDGSNAELCRRRMIEKGQRLVCPHTEGAELITELKPDPTLRLDPDRLLADRFQPIGDFEWIMYKPRWGAFYHTPLEAHLRNLNIDSLTVTGCNFPNCPRTTIYEASERDFRIFLVEDAVSGLADKDKREMTTIGVHLTDTRGIINSVADSESPLMP